MQFTKEGKEYKQVEREKKKKTPIDGRSCGVIEIIKKIEMEEPENARKSDTQKKNITRNTDTNLRIEKKSKNYDKG